MDMSIRFPGINLVLDYVPRAFQIFGMEFTIYGMLIAVGALLGMGLVVLEAGRNHEDQNKYLDMMILSLAASVVGSRLFYVIFSWELTGKAAFLADGRYSQPGATSGAGCGTLG